MLTTVDAHTVSEIMAVPIKSSSEETKAVGVSRKLQCLLLYLSKFMIEILWINANI